jgi:hypothetical protein
MTLEKLRYPTGRFEKPDKITGEMIGQYITEISMFPEHLRSEVEKLSEDQLDTVYRPDGWTIRQVVHHCADSHMNSLVRLKLTLTEDKPTIKPYFEDRWAELTDSKSMPIEPALKMLEGVHKRWTFLLAGLTDDQWTRSFIHPEHGRAVRLDQNTALYAWHCKHHLAHVTTLKKSKGW